MRRAVGASGAMSHGVLAVGSWVEVLCPSPHFWQVAEPGSSLFTPHTPSHGGGGRGGRVLLS